MVHCFLKHSKIRNAFNLVHPWVQIILTNYIYDIIIPESGNVDASQLPGHLGGLVRALSPLATLSRAL